MEGYRQESRRVCHCSGCYNLVDRALGDAYIFRDATIFFYLADELLSILENIGCTGVDVPEPLRREVEILRGKGEAKT